jgi:hypothetical protein
MKLMALMLLVSGWGIVLAAVVLLPEATRAMFALAGVAIEVLGLALAFRAHLPQRGNER